jgi:hypothetical protein
MAPIQTFGGVGQSNWFDVPPLHFSVALSSRVSPDAYALTGAPLGALAGKARAGGQLGFPDRLAG